MAGPDDAERGGAAAPRFQTTVDVTLDARDQPAARCPDRGGQTIGRYRVVRQLGAGGMGVVYEAVDPMLDRRVAVKVLQAVGNDARSAHLEARLLREARALARLHHPNVVTVYDADVSEQGVFVAMQLVDGEAMDKVLTRGALPWHRALELIVAAGRGLSAAHAAGIMHRDVKPSNIFIDDDGTVRIGDFGLARSMEEDSMPPSEGATSPLGADITRTGVVLGTPRYMAPEQHLGQPATAQSDQFSLCVTLYEALCGIHPFAAPDRNLDGVLAAMRADAVRPPPKHQRVPRWLVRAVRRGLRFDPELRFRSIDALLTALRPPLLHRRGFQAAAVAAAVAGVAMVVALGRAPALPPCRLAAAAIDDAWSPARRAGLTADVAAVAAPAFDHARNAWLAAHRGACAEPEATTSSALACLEDARDRLGALVAATASAPATRVRSADVAELVPDATTCREETAPTVPEARDIATTLARSRVRRKLMKLMLAARAYDVWPEEAMAALDHLRTDSDRAGDCVSAAEVVWATGVLHLRRNDAEAAREAFEGAAVAADRCGHDLVRAQAAVGLFNVAVRLGRDPAELRVLRERAAAAVARAGADPALATRIDAIDVDVAIRADHLDEAAAAAEKVLAAERGRSAGAAVSAALVLSNLLYQRGRGDDRSRSRHLLDETILQARHAFGPEDPQVTAPLAAATTRTWLEGDHPGARVLADQIWAVVDRPVERRMQAWTRNPPGPRLRIEGIVRGPDGAPVAGAEVVAGPIVIADSLSLDPMISAYTSSLDVNRAVSSRDGTFTMDVAPGSLAIAAQGLLCSRPLPVTTGLPIDLRLTATGSAVGRVVFGLSGPRPTVVVLRHLGGDAALPLPMFVSAAPVAADGTFSLSRLPAGRYQVSARTAVAGPHIERNAEVEVQPGIPATITTAWQVGDLGLDLIVRSDRSVPVPFAQAVIVRGRLQMHTFSELWRATIKDLQLANSHPVDHQTGGPYLPGDLVIHFESLVPGAVTVCVIPIIEGLIDPKHLTRVQASSEILEVVCRETTIAPTPAIQSLVIDAPPMKRLPP